jgi:organic hydroperoxide reductase OsmC/OhrA
MHPYPHVYKASAVAQPSGSVAVASPGLHDIATAPPAEFDGPGDLWSPETLLCAAIADCFILTFRAIVKRAPDVAWSALDCRVDGVLEKTSTGTRFTRCTTHATLTLSHGSDTAKARELLEKAERLCLITNSLSAARSLEVEIRESG